MKQVTADILELTEDDLKYYNKDKPIAELSFFDFKNLTLSLFMHTDIVYYLSKEYHCFLLKNRYGVSGLILDEGILLEDGWKLTDFSTLTYTKGEHKLTKQAETFQIRHHKPANFSLTYHPWLLDDKQIVSSLEELEDYLNPLEYEAVKEQEETIHYLPENITEEESEQ